MRDFIRVRGARRPFLQAFCAHAKQFPYFSLLVVGVLSIVFALINLEWVISAMLTGRILIQFVAQIFAVHYLRKYRPDIERPFKTWFYPLPNAIAFLGWTYIFLTSGWGFILFGVLTLAAGVVAFWLWRRNAGSRRFRSEIDQTEYVGSPRPNGERGWGVTT